MTAKLVTGQERSPKVTVYIANHNYERFVQFSIESVLKQTFEDWELIIIDDGSKDGSHAVIRKFEDHPKVKVVFQQQQGLNVTNNIALRLARGEYFMRLDADDTLAPEALETMTSVMDRNPNVGLVFPDFYHVDADGEIIELVRRHNFDDVALLDQPAHGACTMIRRACLEHLGGYDESYSCQDGVDLWLRFIEHFEVRNINLPLFYYRRHGSNLTRNESRLLATRAQILAKRANLENKSSRVVAVVPVRGKKMDPRSLELEELCGKPLIFWTIDSAVSTDRVDQVVVTSPDRDVLDIVSAHYDPKTVQCILRDQSLADINTDLSYTVRDVLEQLQQNGATFEYCVTLLVESPFRNSLDIEMGIDVVAVFDTDCAVSVRPDLDNFYQHNGRGMQPIRRHAKLRLEREELYREAGQIYVAKTSFLLAENQIIGGRIGHFIVHEPAALRLTSELNWKIAEKLASLIS
ncbi:glycosyltransferase [Thalassospira sp.]|uniref:glycosyltransferase n=1 Tax=Thalassospira sp. TaxID=1912094 RepID=UPI001B01F07E|nr:glycosyltransferase [Thalassospira sp.]MBO6805954.1 glycosyltransferase [Thalassospira sp.]